MKDVCDITSWSRTSIYRLIDEEQFPAPVKLGSQRIAFRETEVRAYVASRSRVADHKDDATHERAEEAT
jgi:prophage regulatory protein